MKAHQFKFQWLVSDFLLFMAPAVVFNILYVSRYDGARDGALFNIFLTFLLWGMLTSFRLLLARFLSTNKMAKINFALMACAWVLLFIFYALCLLGLTSWGNIPTIMILKVYANQMGSIIDVLNLSKSMIFLIGLATLLVLLFFYKIVWSKTQWLVVYSNKLRPSIAVFVFTSMILICTTLFWNNVYFVAAQYNSDVFTQVFFPEFNSQVIQNWRLHTSGLQIKAENTSRNSYKKGFLKKPRNIIVIVVDALRADHLSINHYSRITTPFIDSLNHDGQLQTIRQMRSVCAESSCGLLSLARSKYPNSMTSVDFSLYEVLKRYGYKVHFFLSGDHTNFYNLKEAFKPYDSYIDGSSFLPKTANYINDDRFLIKELNKLPHFDGTPTYIQCHLMSVHGLGLRFKSNAPYSPAKNYYNLISLDAIQGGEKRKQSAINYYDNGVTQADAIVASIFATLKDKGYLNNALIIITGDHGEMLGEDNYYSHAKTIQDQVLNIPFVIWSSKPNDSSIDFKKWPITSQIDIAPTILHALGITIPSSWKGTALQDAPKNRTLLVMQGEDYGVYASYKGKIYKLTLNRKNATEQSWILNTNSSQQINLLKATIPPTLLKEMRFELYKMDM